MSVDAEDTGPVGKGLDDHDFDPPPVRPWALCRRCGYGQAAHSRVPDPYVGTAPRAPEGAVRTGDDNEEQK